MDDGQTWSEAEMIDPPGRGAWSLLRYRWHVPQKTGAVTLRSRATDSSGASQPPEHDKRYGSYAIHHTVEIEVNGKGRR